MQTLFGLLSASVVPYEPDIVPPAGLIALFPVSGSIAYTGGTPTVTLSGAFILTPGADTIVYTGAAPTVSLSGSITLSPATGTIAYTGGTPVVHLDTGIALYPEPDTILYLGGTPTLSFTLTPGPGQIIYNGGTVGISLVRTVGTGNQLYIGNILYCWKESTFRITKQLSGNWSAEFSLDYFGASTPVSGINKPQVGQEVALFWQSVKRFGGYVQSVAEVGQKGTDASVGGRITYSRFDVKVGGYQLLTDRAIIAKLFTIPIGGLSGIVVYEIWREKLAQFGVTKIGDSPSTFIGEQLFHYITITEALNRVKAQDPGYDWWIDDNKLLHYESTDPAGSATAPFTIRNGDRNVDTMTVTKSDVRFRNKQWVLPSADIKALRTDTTTQITPGNIVFETVYALNVKPIVTVDSGAGPVNKLVTELGSWIPGWQFYYIPGGIGVFAGSAPAIADVVDVSYPNPFPLAFSAQDDTSIAAVGLYEAIWQAKNVFTQVTAEQEAQGLLDLYSQGGYPIQIVFEYDSQNQSAWLTPGMIIDVDRTFPTALGKFTVEQVASQEQKVLWRHTVTLRAGLGEVTDAQALEQFRLSARVPIDSPPYRLTFEVYKTVTGATNPGASAGLLTGFAEVQTDGVIASWDGQFPVDPPTGADMQMDILLNGTSIFPTGAANTAVIPDGQTSQATGIRFVTDNIQVARGDIVTLNCLQSGTGAKDGVFHLNIKVTPNVAQ